MKADAQGPAIAPHPSGRTSAPPEASVVDPRDGPCWEADVPLVTNPLVMRQFGVVALGSGLFMAFLLTLISAATGEFEQIPVMLLISLLAAAGLGLLLIVVALLVYGNRIRLRFTLDAEGAHIETVDRRARAGNRGALLAGVLAGSPGTAGAGALASARETTRVRWRDLSAAAYAPRQPMIILRSSWRAVGVLVCLPENYGAVAHYVRNRIPDTLEPARMNWWPLGRALVRTALVVLAMAPVFALASYPAELDLLLPLILLMFSLATVWLIPLFGWVVMGCGVILAVQITWRALSDAAYWDGYQQAALILSYAGLAYLAWAAWRSVRGRTRPLLLED
mgnify:CR=1 FL=1